jgi:erythromycin esterase-like protein
LPGSYEALFDETGNGDFFLTLRGASDVGDGLREPRLQRAIGVVYRPETERFSHYFTARLADQFDAIVHLNETVAVEPLDRDAGWEVEGELPETFPFGV